MVLGNSFITIQVIQMERFIFFKTTPSLFKRKANYLVREHFLGRLLLVLQTEEEDMMYIDYTRMIERKRLCAKMTSSKTLFLDILLT